MAETREMGRKAIRQVLALATEATRVARIFVDTCDDSDLGEKDRYVLKQLRISLDALASYIEAHDG